jgi:hypothetical protein
MDCTQFGPDVDHGRLWAFSWHMLTDRTKYIMTLYAELPKRICMGPSLCNWAMPIWQSILESIFDKITSNEPGWHTRSSCMSFGGIYDQLNNENCIVELMDTYKDICACTYYTYTCTNAYTQATHTCIDGITYPCIHAPHAYVFMHTYDPMHASIDASHPHADTYTYTHGFVHTYAYTPIYFRFTPLILPNYARIRLDTHTHAHVMPYTYTHMHAHIHTAHEYIRRFDIFNSYPSILSDITSTYAYACVHMLAHMTFMPYA